MRIHVLRWIMLGSIVWAGMLLSISVNAADLAEGLMAYYPFNGNALDESGNRNHGLAVGATLIEDRFGRADSAYYFDGVDDTVWIINSPSLNEQTAVTISAWIYLDSYPTKWVSIVNKWSSYVLQINPQYGLTLTLYDKVFKGVWRNVPVEKDFALGQWYHVAASFDEESGVTQLYINGAPVSAEPRLDYGYPTAINGGSDDVKLGSEHDSQWWHGAIDDTRIYERALSNGEIADLYNETPPVPQTVISFNIDSVQIDMATGEVRLKAKLDPNDPALQSLVTDPQVRLSLELQTQSNDTAMRFGVAAQGQVPAQTLPSEQVLRYGEILDDPVTIESSTSQRCNVGHVDNGRHLGVYKQHMGRLKSKDRHEQHTGDHHGWQENRH